MNAYTSLMRDMAHTETPQPQWLRKAISMQETEGNPLSAEQIAMFEDFEARGLTHEQRRVEIQKWVFEKYGVVAKA